MLTLFATTLETVSGGHTKAAIRSLTRTHTDTGFPRYIREMDARTGMERQERLSKCRRPRIPRCGKNAYIERIYVFASLRCRSHGPDGPAQAFPRDDSKLCDGRKVLKLKYFAMISEPRTWAVVNKKT